MMMYGGLMLIIIVLILLVLNRNKVESDVDEMHKKLDAMMGKLESKL